MSESNWPDEPGAIHIDHAQVEAEIPGGVSKSQVIELATEAIGRARQIPEGTRKAELRAKITRIVEHIKDSTILLSLCSVMSDPHNDLDRMLAELHDFVRPGGSTKSLEWMDWSAGFIVKIDRSWLM